jgi:hypothetical protein
MTRETAVSIAELTFGSDRVRNLESPSAIRKQRDSRYIWLVIFDWKEERGTVISPGEVFVEVDEETEAARIILNP